MAESPSVAFGKPMRDHFLLAKDYLPLNHGSFGTYPKSVRDELHTWQDRSEARPDTFIRYDYPKLLDSACKAIAAYLEVPAQEVVFLPNATTGINTVLRSLVFESGDVIVHLSTIYGACAKTVEYICETTPAESFNVKVEYPVGDDRVIAEFIRGLDEVKTNGKKVKVAIFDTISSLPGVSVPWEKLVETCKERGILSLVDGAHSVGQINLSLGKVQPDFFVSNCHKWLYVPRGCAVFYVPERNQHIIRTSLPTSHGFVPVPREGSQTINSPLPPSKGTPFNNLFKFVATLDNSPYLCIQEALQFRREVCGGEEKILKYCTDLATTGGRKTADILGTDVMEETGSLKRCFFANIRLPIPLGSRQNGLDERDAISIAVWIAGKLVTEYDAYLGIYLHAGNLWARLSAQIYIDLDDIEKGAKALKMLCDRVVQGDYRQV